MIKEIAWTTLFFVLVAGSLYLLYVDATASHCSEGMVYLTTNDFQGCVPFDQAEEYLNG